MRNPHNDPLVSAETGTAKGDKTPSERRCVLTGQTASRDGLLRLALSPDGLVMPDVLARAPGRGAWVSANQAELREAVDCGALRGALSRAFKSGDLNIPDDLPQLAEQGLVRAFTQRLGLELRTGRLILGAERIANDARMGKIVALYHAADASKDGAGKLDQAQRVGLRNIGLEEEAAGYVGLWLPLDRGALSVALGRGNVVHIGVADKQAASRVDHLLGRLINFMQADPAPENTIGSPAQSEAAEPVTTI